MKICNMDRISLLIIPFIFLMSCNEGVNKKDCGKETVIYEKKQETLSSLEICPQKIELGDVKKEAGKHMFYNKGKQPIVIQKLDVSCGCIKTKLFGNIIEPNKSVKMEIDINPENKIGFFSKAIFVRSTANKKPDLIRVKANFID